MHKFIVAIVWRKTIGKALCIGRGSGVLVSPNLILTVAHNFYYKPKVKGINSNMQFIERV